MSVEVTRLPSGLTVVTDRMDHLQSASLGVWVNAGSRSERQDENGLAHLMEHMAFKGTTTRSAAQIAEEFEDVGGDFNAMTSNETTHYYARVLKEDVPLAVDILSDILTRSVIDPDELALEQNVIVQEIGASLDVPEDLVYDQFSETTFPDQPLGRPILGTEETVRAMNRDTIVSYLERHYRGGDMVLAAAGAIRHGEVVELAQKGFGGLAGGNGPKPEAARYGGGDNRVMRDQQEAQIVLGFEGRPYSSPDYYTAQILASALGGGMSTRLFQEVREKRGLCYSIYAYHQPYVDSGIFAIHAATGESHVDALMPVILGEMEKAAHDLRENEIARAKAQARAGLLMALESPTARAGQLARQMLIYGRPVPLEEQVALVDAVTVDSVRRLADVIFTSSTPTLAAIGPIGKLIAHDRLAERLGAPAAA